MSNQKNCKFFGLDNSYVYLRLQKSGGYNSAIKNQVCVNVSCRKFADAIHISDKGLANLCYCHNCADSWLMSHILRGDKDRGKWFTVWNGELIEMYSQKYIVYPFLKKIKNFNKQYSILEKYYRPMTKKQIKSFWRAKNTGN